MTIRSVVEKWNNDEYKRLGLPLLTYNEIEHLIKSLEAEVEKEILSEIGLNNYQRRITKRMIGSRSKRSRG